MRILTTLFILFCVAVHAEDIKTADGQVLKDATITKSDAIGVNISHADGIARVAYDQLPEELRKKFTYDPKLAQAQAAAERDAATQKAQAAQVAQEASRARSAKAATEGDATLRDAAALRKLGDSAFQVRLKVVQSTGDIVLANYQLGSGVVGKGPTYVENSGTAELPIAVAGLNTLVDGERWEGVLYPAGTYRYTTVTGAAKSVRMFAPSPQEALQLLKQ